MTALFIVLALTYFLPSTIAILKWRHNSVAIIALNILLGWTWIGWVVSLLWALTSSPETKTINVANNINSTPAQLTETITVDHEKTSDIKSHSEGEFFKSVSLIFNDKSERIGYEYEVIVDSNHIRTARYGIDGNIFDVKHTFTNPLNTGSSKDFLDYMHKIESIASLNNLSYVDDMNRKPIDLTSSLREAKLWKKFENNT